VTRPEADAPGDDSQRLDRWLVFARFFKTRALAADLVGAGRVRVNGQRVSKPGRTVRPGDVLTFAQGGRVRVIRVLAPGSRRGPPSEARGLYHDLDPAPDPSAGLGGGVAGGVGAANLSQDGADRSETG